MNGAQRRSHRNLQRSYRTPGQLPRREGVLFPAAGGGRIDIDDFRSREWNPALKAAGLPRRRLRRRQTAVGTLWARIRASKTAPVVLRNEKAPRVRGFSSSG